jgi:hypothetical protein
MSIPAALRRVVVVRAGNRCEYCRLSQAGQEARFHIDHILPETHGGKTVSENLALACVSCSLRKGARQAVPDPVTKKRAMLFHPRTQRWNDHFVWKGCRVEGKSLTGRATVEALKLNRLLALSIRAEEQLRGRHPPRC